MDNNRLKSMQVIINDESRLGLEKLFSRSTDEKDVSRPTSCTWIMHLEIISYVNTFARDTSKLKISYSFTFIINLCKIKFKYKI